SASPRWSARHASTSSGVSWFAGTTRIFIACRRASHRAARRIRRTRGGTGTAIPSARYRNEGAAFPAMREARATVIEPARLRWIGFSHVESDEGGALNDWLAVTADA